MNSLFCWIYPIISIYISIFLWLKTTFSPLDSGSCTSNKTKHLGQVGDAAMRAFKLLLFGCLSDQRGGGYRDNQKMAIFTGKRWKHLGFLDLYQCTWQKNDDITWLWPLHTCKQNMISNSRRYTSFIWVAYRKPQQKDAENPMGFFRKAICQVAGPGVSSPAAVGWLCAKRRQRWWRWNWPRCVARTALEPGVAMMFLRCSAWIQMHGF